MNKEFETKKRLSFLLTIVWLSTASSILKMWKTFFPGQHDIHDSVNGPNNHQKL